MQVKPICIEAELGVATPVTACLLPTLVTVVGLTGFHFFS